LTDALLAQRVLERCAVLGDVSEEDGLLVRRYGTDAMRRANELVGAWMRAAGMEVREDAVGNLVGRLAGPDGARTLVLGSHLDSVRDAGRYDGPLGVLVALAAVERVQAERLPFAVEVIGFADEEGVRFGTAYLGSAAVAGRFDPRWLQLRDAEGVALRDLLRGDPATAARDPSELLGYAEVHIEQGPVLEGLGEPVGAVTAIAGQTHAEVRFDGEAGHAGTVPMDARRDALAAAAEWVLAVEGSGVLATVGRIAVEPGARNVIPARARLSLDVRDADDATRRAAVGALRERAREIARRRGLDLAWDETGDVPAVAMDERLTSAFGVPVRLPSGAGHDAATMASITPAAMLFVRCRGGISHNPAESVEEADVAVAIDVLERFLHAV
jgi:allantoate deiminase